MPPIDPFRCHRLIRTPPQEAGFEATAPPAPPAGPSAAPKTAGVVAADGGGGKKAKRTHTTRKQGGWRGARTRGRVQAAPMTAASASAGSGTSIESLWRKPELDSQGT